MPLERKRWLQHKQTMDLGEVRSAFEVWYGNFAGMGNKSGQDVRELSEVLL